MSRYDEGLSGQFFTLSQGSLVGKWAGEKVFRRLSEALPLQKEAVNRSLVWKPILVVSLLLVIVWAVVPKKVWQSSTAELTTGVWTRPLSSEDLLDTVKVKYGDFWKPTGSNFTPVLPGSMRGKEKIQVFEDFEVEWLFRGRLVKSQFILCDSVPQVSNWFATITPPSYTELSSYTQSDTLEVFNGSKVILTFNGLLTDELLVNVSRETSVINNGFTWNSGDEVVVTYRGRSQFPIPIVEREDEAPKILVLKNTRDSLTLQCSDDFQLTQLAVAFNSASPKAIRTRGAELQLNLEWGSFEEITVRAADHVQHSVRTIRRPSVSTQSLLAQSAEASLQETLPKNQAEQLQERRREQERKREREERQEEEERDELRLPKQLNPREELTKEEYEALMERLEQQWKMEQLAKLLEQVEQESNPSLDSAISEVNEELGEAEQTTEELQGVQEQIKAIPESGEQREEQAKDAAEKLREMLAEMKANVMEENVERIKRLLKNSWATTTLQEEVSAIVRDGSRIRQQREILRLERNVQDSLDLLLIHEEKLARQLTSVREALSGAMEEMRQKIEAGKDLRSDMGYALTALNNLDATLYFILESEKEGLQKAKAQCKNGKPNPNGKPNSAGEGPQGQQPNPAPGQKPGGRQQGQTGQPREGKNGTQGGGGEGGANPELLRRMEDAIKKLAGEGRSEEQEELERMKDRFLFQNDLQETDFREIEDKLWQAEQSEFQKEEQGPEREGREGSHEGSQSGAEVQIEVRQSTRTDLPLPVLKSKK